MPATKTKIDVTSGSGATNWRSSSVTLTAGAADTNSDAINLADSYGAVIQGRIVNGGTGPTVAAQVKLQVSHDGSNNWVDHGGPVVGKTTNSATQYFSFFIPPQVMYARLVAGSNTGQNVTIDNCYAMELTTL